MTKTGNLMAAKRKYQKPAEMQKAIKAYFAKLKKDKEKSTICGLTLALGFSSKQSLYNYEDYGEKFKDVVQRARLTIEDSYEKQLRDVHPTGAIFALKNFGWKDTQELTGADGGPIQLNFTLTKTYKKP